MRPLIPTAAWPHLSTAPAAVPAKPQAEDEPEQAEYSVDVMLSLLAAERQDGLAAWSGRLDGPGAKLAIVAGGALAVALAEGLTLETAVQRGCAAGALAATRLGAQPSIPSQVEINQLIAEGNQ